MGCVAVSSKLAAPPPRPPVSASGSSCFRLCPEGAATCQPGAERSGAAAERRPGVRCPPWFFLALKGPHIFNPNVSLVQFDSVRSQQWAKLVLKCHPTMVLSLVLDVPSYGWRIGGAHQKSHIALVRFLLRPFRAVEFSLHRLPRAALRGCAAALCPGLLCLGPFRA